MKPYIALITLLFTFALLNTINVSAEEADSILSYWAGRGNVIIPLSSPLNDFESNGLAWWSALNLVNKGQGYVTEHLNLGKSSIGRSTNILIIFYFNNLISYYSHEIAHDFIFAEKGLARFRVDWSDWSNLAPAYIHADWLDFWEEEDLQRYMEGDEETTIRMTKKILLEIESGLYQQKFNAIRAVRNLELSRKIDPAASVSYLVTQFEDLLYILLRGREEISEFHDPRGYTLEDGNDITGYIQNMKDLNIRISLDKWLIASFASDLLSAHTINSIYAVTRYILYGDESVSPIKFKVGRRLIISPPNFYLFPSIRGLFLQSETFMDFGNSACFLNLGTGLDAFGINATGKVDRIRIGGQYYSVKINSGPIRMTMSPYMYLNFSNRFEHLGQCLGVEVDMFRLGRLSLYAKYEYNKNDMIEQIIKYKNNGFYFISGLNIEF